MFTFIRQALLVLAQLLGCLVAQAQDTNELSGVFRGDDGSALYVLQREAEIFAFAEHPGRQYAWVGRGTRSGNRIKLDWWDVPKGSRESKGSVELDVLQLGTRLQRRTGDSFGAADMERIALAQVPWAGPRAAGFQDSGTSKISGAYDGNDASRWYVRATSDHTVGVIEAASQPGERPAFVSVFFGKRVHADRSDFSGPWVDMPKGQQSRSGNLGAALLTPATAIWGREIMVEQTGVDRTVKIAPDYTVDYKAMAASIEGVMQGSGAVGWSYAIATAAGGIVKKGAGGHRRLKVDGAERDFTTKTLAQAASFSKTSTAIALARVLKARGLSFDSPIAGFLPACWTRGKGVSSLSFGDLASHNTGFEAAGNTPYQMVKQPIENGNVREPSGFVYRNTNYGVMRYLVPLVAQRDKALAIFEKWDCKDSRGDEINREISAIFAGIVLSETFPASVAAGMAYAPSGNFSFNYNWEDPKIAGSPPNPEAAERAGAGYLAQSAESSVMMLRALDMGEIVPVGWARTMKQQRYGFDGWYASKAGPAAWKNGGCPESPQGHDCAAWGIVFPGGTYVYLVMNSGRRKPQSEATKNLGAILLTAYDGAFR